MSPDYLKNLLAELYPRPSLDLAPRLAYLGRLYGLNALELPCRLLMSEPCRMCGAWHGHHEGCPMPRRHL